MTARYLRFTLTLMLLGFALGLMLALAQGPPPAAPAAPPVPPPPPQDINAPANETLRLKLVNSFQRALLMQQAKFRADADFDAARNDYTALADQTAAELKLPKGSEFVIDTKGTVQVRMPPPVPPKPEEKKP